MILRRIVTRHVDEQVHRALTPPPAELPLAVEAFATVAQWAGAIVGGFVKGLQR